MSGTSIAPPEPTFQADPADVSDAELVETSEETTDEGSGEELPEPNAEQDAVSADSRIVDGQSAPTANNAPMPETNSSLGEEMEPDEQPVDELERLPPRPPLSESAVSQQPQATDKEKSDEWKSTRLFKPVASSAGVIEAQGYRIALAGIEPLPPDEKCSFEGTEWPCGLQARTAFRSWLRGRAVACVVPPKPGEEQIVAECYIGKTDLSEWLASNGWARPISAGPYEEAGKKANEARKGIYGRAPVQSGINLPRVADPAPMSFPETAPAPKEQLPAPPPQAPLNGPFPPAPAPVQ